MGKEIGEGHNISASRNSYRIFAKEALAEIASGVAKHQHTRTNEIGAEWNAFLTKSTTMMKWIEMSAAE